MTAGGKKKLYDGGGGENKRGYKACETENEIHLFTDNNEESFEWARTLVKQGTRQEKKNLRTRN